MASARARDTDLKSKSISILNFWLDSIRFDFHWCNVLNPWYLSCFLLLYRCQFFFFFVSCVMRPVYAIKKHHRQILLWIWFSVLQHTLWVNDFDTPKLLRQQQRTVRNSRNQQTNPFDLSCRQLWTLQVINLLPSLNAATGFFFLGELFSFMLLHFQWHRLSFPCLCCFKYLLVDLCWFLLATSWRAVQFIMIKYGTLAQLENSSTRYFASIITY